jgi:hypothetical protein
LEKDGSAAFTIERKMSRVHVRFVREPLPEDSIAYEVVSPDFSSDSVSSRVLGRVVVNREDRSYRFDPSDLWRELCFVDVNLLADPCSGISQASKVEGINYAWRIHRAISSMIEEDDFV